MGKHRRFKVNNMAVPVVLVIGLVFSAWMITQWNWGISGVDWAYTGQTVMSAFAYLLIYSVVFYSIAILPSHRRTVSPVAYPLVFTILGIVTVGFFGFLDSNNVIVLADITDYIPQLYAGIVIISILIGILLMIVNR